MHDDYRLSLWEGIKVVLGVNARAVGPLCRTCGARRVGTWLVGYWLSCELSEAKFALCQQLKRGA